MQCLGPRVQHGRECFARGWPVQVGVRNLRNTERPSSNGNSGHTLGGAQRHKGFVSNPFGRGVSLGLRVRL